MKLDLEVGNNFPWRASIVYGTKGVHVHIPITGTYKSMHVTLACINDKTFHNFLQTIDLSLINTTNEDDENPPLILETLVILDWTLLLETSNINSKKGLMKIK
jgi:hypothetical protein